MESDAESLVLENQRLIGFFCKRQPPPWWMSIDEYSGEMMIAMWCSAKKYDSALGASFATYALRGMKLCAQDLHRRRNSGKLRLLNRTIYMPDGNPMDIAMPETRCSAFDFVDKHLVGILTRPLTEQHQKIVKWRMQGLSFREIALLVGCRSHQTALLRYLSALRIMRRIARLNGITPASAGL